MWGFTAALGGVTAIPCADIGSNIVICHLISVTSYYTSIVSRPLQHETLKFWQWPGYDTTTINTLSAVCSHDE